MSRETLEVPLNRAKFQKFRNNTAVLAGMGLFMVLYGCFSGAYLFQSIFTDPKIRSFVITGFVASAWFLLFVGMSTIPAWQLAWTQTKILKRNTPALVIDRDGIVDNASNYMLGRIPWSEIESVEVANRYSSNPNKTFTGIVFVLKNKQMLLQKKPKIMAMWMQADPEITKKRQVFIPQGRIDVSVAELVAQVNEFRTGTAR